MDGLPQIYVEGRDDMMALISLLEVHGISFSEGCRKVSFVELKSVDTVLDSICTIVKSAQNQKRPVGFVLDIDADINARWRAVSAQMAKIGLNVSANVPSENGIIVDSSTVAVGFWLMPDNKSRSGKLEDFLKTLVPQGDGIFDLSVSYVGKVKETVIEKVRFRDKDTEKAELSAWLAVQNPPGLPYGTAIKANVLKPNSPVAEKFIEWFKRLFSL